MASLRRLRFVAVFVVGLGIGGAGTYFLLHFYRSSFSHRWLDLEVNGSGFGWTSAALLDSDIQLPDLTNLHGRAKLLDWNEGEIRLGYIVRVSVKHLDVTKIPEKYKHPRSIVQLPPGYEDAKPVNPATNYEIEPLQEVVYEAHMDFVLKDADGFTLMTLKSEPLDLYSGKENVFQGTSAEAIPFPVAKRTKHIMVELMAERCESCTP